LGGGGGEGGKPCHEPMSTMRTTYFQGETKIKPWVSQRNNLIIAAHAGGDEMAPYIGNFIPRQKTTTLRRRKHASSFSRSP